MYSFKFGATMQAFTSIMARCEVKFLVENEFNPPSIKIHYHLLEPSPPNDRRKSIRKKKVIKMYDIDDHTIRINGAIYNYNQVSIKLIEMII